LINISKKACILVPRFPLPRFPPLRFYRAEFSAPAFSVDRLCSVMYSIRRPSAGHTEHL